MVLGRSILMQSNTAAPTISLQKIIGHLPGMFLILDANYRFIDASDAYLGSIDKQRNDLVNQSIFTIAENSSPCLLLPIAAIWRDILKKAATTPFQNNVTAISDVNGIEVYKLYSLCYLSDEQEDRFYILSFVPLLAKHDELALYKSQYIAAISHELRSPLHCILGFAKLLLHDKSASIADSQVNYINEILKSAEHLSLITDDLLDIARIDARKIKFNFEEIYIQHLINDIALSFHQLIQEHDIHLTIDIDTNLNIITSDPKRLKQIVINYLSNAIKFTPNNGKITIKVSHIANDHFCIAVKDTGPGIKEHDLDRLFIPFQQLDDNYTRKDMSGSGLGLSLVKHLAESLDGHVGVLSKIGVGSEFYVVLPYSPSMEKRTAHS